MRWQPGMAPRTLTTEYGARRDLDASMGTTGKPVMRQGAHVPICAKLPRREGENPAARHGMTPGAIPFGPPHDVGGSIYILSRVIRSIGSTREDHPPALRGRLFSRSTRPVNM